MNYYGGDGNFAFFSGDFCIFYCERHEVVFVALHALSVFIIILFFIFNNISLCYFFDYFFCIIIIIEDKDNPPKNPAICAIHAIRRLYATGDMMPIIIFRIIHAATNRHANFLFSKGPGSATRFFTIANEHNAPIKPAIAAEAPISGAFPCGFAMNSASTPAIAAVQNIKKKTVGRTFFTKGIPNATSIPRFTSR